MWWLFEKLTETDTRVDYAYSRENRVLDGRISIDKTTQEITLVKPGSNDVDSRFAQETLLQKTWRIIRLGYPQHEQIACG